MFRISLIIDVLCVQRVQTVHPVVLMRRITRQHICMVDVIAARVCMPVFVPVLVLIFVQIDTVVMAVVLVQDQPVLVVESAVALQVLELGPGVLLELVAEVQQAFVFAHVVVQVLGPVLFVVEVVGDLARDRLEFGLAPPLGELLVGGDQILHFLLHEPVGRLLAAVVGLHFRHLAGPVVDDVGFVLVQLLYGHLGYFEVDVFELELVVDEHVQVQLPCVQQ